MKLLFTVLLSGAALLAQTPATPAKPAPKSPAAATKSGTAAKKAVPAARTAPELYRVKLATTKGDVVIEIHRDWAPLGADQFYRLVRSGFFNNAPFFRVVPNFVVQFGLPANPALNANWQKAIKDDPVKQKNTRGAVVFATSGPNTRTTQLFINLKDNSAGPNGLDAQGFAPIGTVTEGMQFVDQFYSGYGDDPGMGGHGPSQDRLTKEGKPYIDKSFPKLDSIKMATVIFPEPPAPAAKKAAPAAPKAAPKTATPAAPAKK